MSDTMIEYTVYELLSHAVDEAEIETGTKPSLSPYTNRIGTVRAESFEEAVDKAHRQYGAPVAIE